MKKFIEFVKKNPMMMLLYVIGMVLMFIEESAGGLMMAAVTAVAPGTPEAEPGITGAPTQAPGEATTVSNASELADDLIQPEIDSEIVKIGTDENVIDTIKRRVQRQVRVNSFEVDHYLVDEKNPKAVVAEEYVGKSGTKSAAIKFTANGKIFQEYYTAICKGVNGYDPTGQYELPGSDLMLFCTNIDATTENPVFVAVNGPKANPTDADTYMPTIPAGTEIILLSSAAYETQKFIAPSTIVPVPERVFLQKQLCNSIVSDYFNAQKKRIPFNEAQVAEAVLRQFRLESCRTAWVGQPGKMKVKAMDAALGYQWDYFTKGLRWQFKRQYTLAGEIEWMDIINLSMMKFTGYNTSKKAIWVMGKGLLSAIQGIDMSKYRQVTVGEGEVLGFKTTKLTTVFGEINIKHDPSLDVLGYSNSGALMDVDGLVRYWMKNESTTKEKVVGEEAKRDIVMSIDALCLKGYSHIWVDGEGIASLPGVMNAKKSATLPEDANVGDTIFLTAAVTASTATGNKAFKVGDIVTFNGDIWEANEELKGIYVKV